jgi:hypothetical protein
VWLIMRMHCLILKLNAYSENTVTIVHVYCLVSKHVMDCIVLRNLLRRYHLGAQNRIVIQFTCQILDFNSWYKFHYQSILVVM